MQMTTPTITTVQLYFLNHVKSRTTRERERETDPFFFFDKSGRERERERPLKTAKLY